MVRSSTDSTSAARNTEQHAYYGSAATIDRFTAHSAGRTFCVDNRRTRPLSTIDQPPAVTKTTILSQFINQEFRVRGHQHHCREG